MAHNTRLMRELAQLRGGGGGGSSGGSAARVESGGKGAEAGGVEASGNDAANVCGRP
jgi:hypothetical protein